MVEKKINNYKDLPRIVQQYALDPMRYCQKSGDEITDTKVGDLTAECVSKAVGSAQRTWRKGFCAPPKV